MARLKLGYFEGGGAARRNYLSQRLRIKLSQSLGTPVPIAAKFQKTPNTAIVEQIATSAITERFSQTGVIRPEVDSSDKKPLWDGDLLVYSSESQTNRELLYKLPLQIKGKVETKWDVDIYKYAVSIDDLAQYAENGGVLFFVVLISRDRRNKRIFSKALIKVKLLNIIQKASFSKQNKKTIQFDRLPDNDQELILQIKQFGIDRKNQYSFDAEDLKSLSQLIKEYPAGQLVTQIPKSSEIDPLETMLITQPSFYIKTTDNVKIPIWEDLEISDISCTRSASVKVGEKQFYDFVNVVAEENGTKKIAIGNFLTFLSSNQLNITFPTSLSQRIEALSFWTEVVAHFQFTIDNIPVLLPAKELRQQAKIFWDTGVICKELSFLKRVRSLLAKLNVHDDIELDKLSKKDLTWLNVLVNSILEGKEVCVDFEGQTALTIVNIQNLKLLLFFVRNELTRRVAVYDFFTNENIACHYTVDKIKCKTSKYSMIDKENFKSLSNLAPENIVSSFMKVAKDNPKVVQAANSTLLDMLSAYDETKSSRLLDACRNLSIWLKEKGGKYLTEWVAELNYLQTIKRIRSLDRTERDLVYKCIADEKAANDIHFGAYLLIGDFQNAKECFDKLTPEKQEEIKSYPIFNFWTQSNIHIEETFL